jgi:hypothetical protein
MTRRRTARKNSRPGKGEAAPPPPPREPTAYEGRAAGGCLLLAIFLGLTLLVWLQVAGRDVRLWWYSERYAAAEFEVQKVEHVGRASRQAYRFEGVVRPGGEAVVGYSRDLHVPGYEGKRQEELKGQTVPVLYWPNHAEKRWLHPPTVVQPGAIPTEKDAVGTIVSWVALLAGVVLCLRPVRRSYKRFRASRPPQPPATWADIGIVVGYFAAIGLMVYFTTR